MKLLSSFVYRSKMEGNKEIMSMMSIRMINTMPDGYYSRTHNLSLPIEMSTHFRESNWKRRVFLRAGIVEYSRELIVPRKIFAPLKNSDVFHLKENEILIEF